MAKTKQQKEEIIKALEEKLGKAKATVFTNFEGLTVSEADELRSHLREANIDYTVAKRTLLALALKKAKLEDVSMDDLSGGLGVAFGYDDEVLPAKTLSEFAKKHKSLKLIGGIFENKFIDAQAVADLASLPSKDELLVKLIWLIQYPTYGFVNVLAGSLRKFIYTLQAIKDSKN